MTALALVSLIWVAIVPPQVLSPAWRPQGSDMATARRAHVQPGVSPRRLIGGQSTWYDYHEGQAAAGPRLRAALGPHWRGMAVRVCTTDVCLRDPVVLTDWCACQPSTRLIDLDVRDFAKLGPPSRGVLAVTVDLP